MPLYAGKDIDLLIAAINRDNPSLKWKLDPTNFIYSKPVEYKVPNLLDHNTQIRVTAKETSPYRGSVNLTYRRIDLAVLFRSQKLELKKYVPKGAYLPKVTYIELLNQKYGLNLEASKISGSDINGGYQSLNVTLTMGALSYQYVGSIVLFWAQDLEELGLDTMTTSELNGALWPNRVSSFDPEQTYQLRAEFLPLYRDFTQESVDNNWPIINTTTTFTLDSGTNVFGIRTLLEEINSTYELGMEFSAYDVNTNPNGVFGRTVGYRFSPINPSLISTYPFLNREGATHVLLVWFGNQPQYTTSGFGFLPFYYNA